MGKNQDQMAIMVTKKLHTKMKTHCAKKGYSLKALIEEMFKKEMVK